MLATSRRGARASCLRSFTGCGSALRSITFTPLQRLFLAHWGSARGDPTAPPLAPGRDPRVRPRPLTWVVRRPVPILARAQLQTFIPEGEFDDFLASLRTPLPSTFRITGNRASAVDVRESLQDVYFERLKGVEVDGEEIQPPKPIPWYPDSLAWHMVLSRPVLRKREDLKSFHRFLVDQNESGNISRQEAVSMIPPLLLGVEPHHKVLDMCAAPGSKTAQLIEALHADGDAIPSGLVVANDAENKRCYLLVHQSKRLQSPSFMITNHDAAVYPNLNLRAPDGTLSPLRYDRVLCDVPCTGDGTFRKNVAAWGKWNPNNAYGLHDLQKRILFRGIELADVGATVVYSTCSFNPVENEAVVAAVRCLRRPRRLREMQRRGRCECPLCLVTLFPSAGG